MLDLNQAQEQSKGLGTIPPNSIVPVRYVMEAPQADRIGSQPCLCQSQNSPLQYIKGYFEVMTGTYQGKKIYNNFNVHGGDTPGRQKAMEISLSTIRALIEAHNQLSPKDVSQRACQLRQLQSWEQVNNAKCFLKVKCEETTNSKTGEVFTVNALKSIITVDDPNYAYLKENKELITDEAIPQVEKKSAPQQQTPQTDWSAPQQNTQYNAQGFNQAVDPTNGWANTFAQNQQQTPQYSAPTQAQVPEYAQAQPSETLDDSPF